MTFLLTVQTRIFLTNPEAMGYDFFLDGPRGMNRRKPDPLTCCPLMSGHLHMGSGARVNDGQRVFVLTFDSGQNEVVHEDILRIYDIHITCKYLLAWM
jgi:hypothetical protein